MQQKALLIPTPKADFVLESHDVPSPGKDEVLIKIMSVALNPMYYKQREYDVLVDEYPAVLGGDMAGVVEEVGENVWGFSKGDRVCVEPSFLSNMFDLDMALGLQAGSGAGCSSTWLSPQPVYFA
jgi:NADPH:quinone reductase-like Zn-dependent oxidoreductase